MDENVRDAIVRGLRQRGVDVLTAQEDGMRRTPDSDVLDRATTLKRLAVSEDEDFLIEAARRQENGQHFSGVVRAPQELPVGTSVEHLEIIAQVTQPGEYDNQVVYLPL